MAGGLGAAVAARWRVRTRKQTDIAYAVALLAVLLLALALRLHLLGAQSVWWDEGFSVWVARQDVLSSARYTATDTQPPLYFWLVHGWRLLAGDSEFGLRFLALLEQEDGECLRLSP